MKTLPDAGWWRGLVCGLGVCVLAAACRGRGEAEFELGRRELERGRAVRARDLLDRSIQLRPGHPTNAVAYNLLGLAHHALGDLGASARAFEESRRLNPALAAPWYNLGCLYRQARQYDRAIEFFAEAARLAPDDPRPLEMIGRIHADHRQWNDAAARWQAAHERAPTSPRILTSLAEVELHRRGPAAAVQFLLKALEHDRRYAPALYNLYVIHAHALGDATAAEPYAQQFLEAAPAEDPRAVGVRAWLEARRGGSRVVAPRALLGTATAAVVKGPPAPTSAVGAVPVPTGVVVSARSPTPADLVEAGRRLAARGRPAEAVERCLEAAARARAAGDAAAEETALRIAVQLGPEEPAAHLALARWLEARGDSTGARAAYAKAAELNPALADAHRGLARLALSSNGEEMDAAVLSLRRVLEIDPDDTESRWTLARLYDEQLNRPADARREYEEFVRRAAGDPRSLTAAERLRAIAQPARLPVLAVTAAPPVRPAAPAAPDPAVPPPAGRPLPVRASDRRDLKASTEAFNRARAYVQRGDLDRAAKEYLRAIELDPQSLLAYHNLGDVYLRAGELDLAREAFRRALMVNPDYNDSRYNLALVLDMLGETAVAREQLAQLIARDPNHAAAHYLLGVILSRDPGSEIEAARALRKFLELSPNDPKAEKIRQWLRARGGR
ncbi:MAG: tetratricopeptide repeat protein [Kiritimatiellae bacterium]|nr:tetratricopeptide repeat protein [Kiritimatiellia bacterium]